MASEQEEQLIEKFAAIEHERWADWQKWMHSLMTDAIVDGKAVFTIPVKNVVRWQAQICTPYSKLSEREKQADRDQVGRYLPLIHAYADRKVAAKTKWLDIARKANEVRIVELEGKLATVKAFAEVLNSLTDTNSPS